MRNTLGKKPPTDKPRVVSKLTSLYSGATLLAILLDRHPELTCDGETFPSVIDRQVKCTCGVNQINCDYYRSACAHMLTKDGRRFDSKWFRRSPLYSDSKVVQKIFARFSRYPAVNMARDVLVRLVPGCRRAELDFLDVHEQFVRNSLKHKPSSVYVDGAKNLNRAALFAASGRFDQKALYLLRDGRGFCRSYIRNTNVGSPGLSVAARMWNDNIRRIDEFEKKFKDVPMMRIRYEDICRDVDQTLRSIFEFIGVSHQPDVLTRTGNSHILGNRMRLKFDGQIKENQAWRTELSEPEIAMISDLMRPNLERFGYV